MKRETSMTMRETGEISKRIKTHEYFIIRPMSEGICIHPTNRPETEHGLLLKNRSATGVRIPREIVECYPEFTYGKMNQITVVNLNGTDFLIKAERGKEFPQYAPSLFTGGDVLFEGTELKQVGDVTLERGSIPERTLEELGLTEAVRVTMHRKNGVWIRIEPAKAKETASDWMLVKHLFGLRLQMYPFEQVQFVKDAGKCPVPEWLTKDIIRKEQSEKWQIFRAEGQVYYLFPTQKCELTETEPDYRREVPQAIELCGECKEEQRELKNLTDKMAEMEQTMRSIERIQSLLRQLQAEVERMS